jgi:hypothetical protein
MTASNPIDHMTPAAFVEWDPEEFEHELSHRIFPHLPLEDRDRFNPGSRTDRASLATGDILLGVGDPARRFMSGIIRRSTRSWVTDVAVVIRNDPHPISVFTVSDLDKRFFHYPAYQPPIELLQPLDTWWADFYGKIFVKRCPGFSIPESISTSAAILAEEYAQTNEVSFCLNARVVARLLGVPLDPKNFIVPGHFVSLYPAPDPRSTFSLLYESPPYVPPEVPELSRYLALIEGSQIW